MNLEPFLDQKSIILTQKADIFDKKIPLARLSWRRARGRTVGVMSRKALSDVTYKIILTLKYIL